MNASMITPSFEQRVRERAYHLWESEGRPSGRHAEHWLRQRTGDARRDRTRRAASKPRQAESRAEEDGAQRRPSRPPRRRGDHELKLRRAG